MKTEFEKKVIIKMRRLRKKKSLFDQIQKELGSRTSKEDMEKFIAKEAALLSIADRRDINAKL